MRAFSRCVRLVGLTAPVLLAFGPVLTAQTLPIVPPPQGAVGPADTPNAPFTVQKRGPVHEAYAQPTEFAPSAAHGPVVNKKPPDPIPETPPETRPAGEDVQWIPGYWAWTAEDSRFLWVSGFWRVPPPNRKWVPGYWSQVGDGSQWVSGFWAPVDQAEAPYVQEAPPESAENGPSVPRPSEDSIYVPGSWIYRDGRFLWRPGYYIAAEPGFVWTPAQYYATPSGYLYVDGYWDRALADRGLLFAPVAFNQPLWNDPNWSFQPDSCIVAADLLSSLFVRPASGCYYFGDYYGPSYLQAGYWPWVSYGARHYDPLFNYYRWEHRDNPNWYRGLVDDYRGRYAGERPRTERLIRPLSEARSDPRLRLGRPNEAQVAAARRFGPEHHETARERARLEAPRGPRAAALPLNRLPSVRQQAERPRITAPEMRGNHPLERRPEWRGELPSIRRPGPGPEAERRYGPRPPERVRPAIPERTVRQRPSEAGRPVPRAERPAPQRSRYAPIRSAPVRSGVNRPAARPVARPASRLAAHPPTHASPRPASHPVAHRAPSRGPSPARHH